MQQYSAFQGSARELIGKGVKVNGRAVDQVSLSVMVRYGIAKEVGTCEKVQGKRGPVGKIYKLQGKPGFVVTAGE